MSYICVLYICVLYNFRATPTPTLVPDVCVYICVLYSKIHSLYMCPVSVCTCPIYVSRIIPERLLPKHLCQTYVPIFVSCTIMCLNMCSVYICVYMPIYVFSYTCVYGCWCTCVYIRVCTLIWPTHIYVTWLVGIFSWVYVTWLICVCDLSHHIYSHAYSTWYIPMRDVTQS